MFYIQDQNKTLKKHEAICTIEIISLNHLKLTESHRFKGLSIKKMGLELFFLLHIFNAIILFKVIIHAS